MKEIILPELGEGIEKAVVAGWYYKAGEQVNKDDDIVEVVTDKAVFNVPTGISGILKNILIEEGEEASVGSPLAVIEPLSEDV